MVSQGSGQEATQLEDIEVIKRALADEMAKSASNLAGWQRAQADLTNYKRRVEQEKEELDKYANATFVSNLLPILDDLERALIVTPPEMNGLPWVEGVRQIERKLRATLEMLGLSPIEALGKHFDPNFHEAVAQCEGEEGLVISELQKGYRLRDRVIRPSRVAVGMGLANKKEA
ncbi:MAG: nucleotide exchange factor GrpE [Chloroflexi bacterium]|nr:nucleotide exchange factor GrpE [Chloroflexota bacterium]